MKVLVTGSAGSLGQELVREFTGAGHDVTGFDTGELDVTDIDAARAVVAGGGWDAVVNAAAWNDVDGAEDPANKDVVWAVNAVAPGAMAVASKDIGAVFVHYSTDYVFDGAKEEGYREDDVPDPLSFYGKSKYAGECAVRSAGGRSYICRVSKLFGRQGAFPSAKPSFVSVMMKLAASKPELSIVDEEVGMPTYTPDVAEATARLIADDRYSPGTYHLINEGPGVTWYGFAEEFFGLQGVKIPRKPVPSSAFPARARRPEYAKLVNTKFPPLRSRREALEAYFRDIYPAMAG